jgi:hypothetical protein
MYRFILALNLVPLGVPYDFLCCEAPYLGLAPQAPSPVFEIKFMDNPARKGFSIKVQTDSTYKGAFPEDHFVLSIHRPPDRPKSVLDQRFVSSYMDYQAKAVDLTGDGVEEIIMITGTGRGTMVRRETLRGLQWNQAHLSTLLSVPFSDPCWNYKLEIVPKVQNKLAHVALRLDATTTVGAFCDSSMIPRHSYLEYKWNRTKRRMILCKSSHETK